MFYNLEISLVSQDNCEYPHRICTEEIKGGIEWQEVTLIFTYRTCLFVKYVNKTTSDFFLLFVC